MTSSQSTMPLFLQAGLSHFYSLCFRLLILACLHRVVSLPLISEKRLAFSPPKVSALSGTGRQTGTPSFQMAMSRELTEAAEFWCEDVGPSLQIVYFWGAYGRDTDMHSFGGGVR
jgi:hypothetical protein